jgi:hypothetical protein
MKIPAFVFLLLWAGLSLNCAWATPPPPPPPTPSISASTILEEALQLTFRIQDKGDYDISLLKIIETLAPSDTERALELSKKFNSPCFEAYAIDSIATALAPVNHQKALAIAKLQSDGEINTLGSVIELIADQYPEEALQAVEGLNYDFQKQEALRTVAVALAPKDANRAAELAQTRIEDDQKRDRILYKIALILLKQNPEQALQIKGSIKSEDYRNDLITAVAIALAKTDPAKALTLARGIKQESARVGGLCGVAAAVAASPAPAN